MRKPPTLEATAFHEAGHAVAAWHLGLRLNEVSIVPIHDRWGEQKGRVECEWGDARSNAIYRLAGGIAQDLFCPGYELGAEDDDKEALNCVRIILGGAHPQGYSKEKEPELLAVLRDDTKGLVLSHEKEVHALRSALLTRRHLKGEEVRLLLEQV